MKTLLTLIFALLYFSVIAQRKTSTNELKRFEWIVYNKSVSNTSDLLMSDTLLLIKSSDNETFEDIYDKDSVTTETLYPRYWHLNLYLESDSTLTENEFFFFFIDIRQASMRKSLSVDSLTYELLLNDTTVLNSISNPLYSQFENLEVGDIVQIINQTNQRHYFIKKIDGKLIVLKTGRRRFIVLPEGINDGFWIYSKQKQLLTFTDSQRELNYCYRVERTDDFRLRLIRTNH